MREKIKVQKLQQLAFCNMGILKNSLDSLRSYGHGEVSIGTVAGIDSWLKAPRPIPLLANPNEKPVQELFVSKVSSKVIGPTIIPVDVVWPL